ncbi:hypothetical protein ADN00_15620 [Ornatilinea apprima]|uniref:Uncharacterized AAA domain-containing protein ycf46 n=1 Tax=Ornatilinea apprima TaxID=1134406 RepID=A0A0P6XAQ3_9CHLR|nr:AAA family ATPase [Ornatilinea apprima]KPL72244.1 hypothetical protein ADN00_15620 [Ornatilinea apprima]
MSESAIQSLDRYIRARYPIIGIASHEESRVMSFIHQVAAIRNRQIVSWSVTQGLKQEPSDTNNLNPTVTFDRDTIREIVAALEEILAFEGDPTLFVFKDLHGIIGNPGRGFDPIIVRYLRDVCARFEQTHHNLVLLSPAVSIPPDLEKVMVSIDWPLPDKQELTEILVCVGNDLPDKYPVHLNGNRENIVQAMTGLTAFEAVGVLNSATVACGKLDESAIPFIVKEKAQIIKKSGVLEFYDSSVTMSEVGGLDNLKRYAQIKRNAFSEKAREAGVDSPKGVLLVGVPGTGKSLSAKAIAGGQMPLLRLDIGSLMGGLVGQSESNMRSALKVAEAVAPCVLWMDEIEKAIGGVDSSNQSDGGTLARLFGTMLTWMQETKSPVYVVATANDVRSLRPELLRRFDDIFWVDLPDAEARREILRVHLDKRGYVLSSDIEKVVEATWSFSGAEIEKVVKSAVEAAFFDEANLSTEYLLQAAQQIIPVGQTMQEQIESLRNWAKDRARSAGKPCEPKPQVVMSRKVMLDL